MNPTNQRTAERMTPPATTSPGRLALVTGASGHVGGQLVPRLLSDGWQVRVLTRRAGSLDDRPWADQVDIVVGDVADRADLRKALSGIRTAYYLIHSMDDRPDFAERDREAATAFGDVAREQEVRRLVYLGGLHPDDEELSPHLASRVEVGRILLSSGVPTAVLQAAVVLGDGSASFDMLRHLTTRLPAMVAPKWLDNRIQPIAVDDVMTLLVGAADLPANVNRTFDIGGPDVLTYTVSASSRPGSQATGSDWSPRSAPGSRSRSSAVSSTRSSPRSRTCSTSSRCQAASPASTRRCDGRWREQHRTRHCATWPSRALPSRRAR